MDCATRGIDSKLDAVVIIADAAGRDLLVERRGGALDFAVPAGRQVCDQGPRTDLQGRTGVLLPAWACGSSRPERRSCGQPSTKPVNSFSWPPQGLPDAGQQSPKASPTTIDHTCSGSRCRATSRAGSFRRRTWTFSSSRRRRARTGGSRSRRSGSACRPIRRSSCSELRPASERKADRRRGADRHSQPGEGRPATATPTTARPTTPAPRTSSASWRSRRTASIGCNCRTCSAARAASPGTSTGW